MHIHRFSMIYAYCLLVGGVYYVHPPHCGFVTRRNTMNRTLIALLLSSASIGYAQAGDGRHQPPEAAIRACARL